MRLLRHLTDKGDSNGGSSVEGRTVLCPGIDYKDYC
jgi:hypothetical protein